MTREEAIGFELLMGVEASVVQDPDNLERFGVHMTDAAIYWTVRECLETMVDCYDGAIEWREDAEPEE